jgi:IS30 family transposase
MARRRAGLSQRQAAKALGVDQKTISNDVRKNSSESEEKLLTPPSKAERRAPTKFRPRNCPGTANWDTGNHDRLRVVFWRPVLLAF